MAGNGSTTKRKDGETGVKGPKKGRCQKDGKKVASEFKPSVSP